MPPECFQPVIVGTKARFMKLQDLLRALPGMDALLATPVLQSAAGKHGRRLTVSEARRQLDELRQRLKARPEEWTPDAAARAGAQVAESVERELERRARGTLVPVLNATGVLVHTNLGRAPLGERVVRRVAEAARESVNLELDLATGRRGRRGAGTDDLLRELTGAEAACVVNNNAAALVLALSTFAAGREVVVSRGELVEIGGSFRVPDVCERANVRLVEVGTTNRTRAADYAAALGREHAAVGMLLKVHPSNFRVVGFTEDCPLEDLVALGRSRGVPVVMDQGSGAMEDLAPWGVPDEPPVPALVATGCDLVLFSGDKLLGGPQAGCLVGRREAVEACRRNPLYRALRVGRLVQVALESVLWAHLAAQWDEIPVLARLRTPADTVRKRAEILRETLLGPDLPAGLALSVRPAFSTSGGGSSPASRVPTFVLAMAGPPADLLAEALRQGQPAVLARIEDDALLLDLRTVPPERDADLAAALRAALALRG